jgi:hypothetical protein
LDWFERSAFYAAKVRNVSRVASQVRLGRLAARRLISSNMSALSCLGGEEKGLDQFTIAANCHAGESLVPLALGYLRLAIEPPGQKF